ncbi:MAG: cell division protein FtsA [Candidatus Omnitrophota bacterium]
MFKSNKLVCGLDLGSRRIKVVAGISLRSGGFSSPEYADAPSRGLRGGVVEDFPAAVGAVKEAVGSLEKKLDRRIKNVYLGVNGQGLSFRRASAVIPLCERGNKVVSPWDIKSVHSQARSLNIKLDEEIIHNFPRGYVLDDGNYLHNPQGLSGHKLAVDLYIIAMKINHLDNFSRLADQAGLKIGDIVFSGVAAARCVLRQEEMAKGCVFVDIGAEVTQFLVFRQGVLHFADIIGYGGNKLTAALAGKLAVPFDLAEEIKEGYACAAGQDSRFDDEVIVKRHNGYLPVSRKEIVFSVQPGIKELLSCLQERIFCSGSQDCPLVITGGTGLLDGFLEMAEKVLGLSVRLGAPRDLLSLANRAAGYSAAVGLMHYAVEHSDVVGRRMTQAKDGLRGAWEWLKGVYGDYF